MKFRRFLSALWAAALLFSTLPAALAEETPAFSDAADIQYQEAVSAVVSLGLMTGKSDGSFDPAGPVSRGEAAKIMASLYVGGKELTWMFRLPADNQPSFPDIEGHWAEEYIQFCASKGMVFPQEDGTFSPNEPITQFELLRMADIALGALPSDFTKSTNWIVLADTLAWHRGLYTGIKTSEEVIGKPLTDHPVTREETAQILYNTLNATPQTLTESSTGFFEDVKRPDGTPSTLLYECYGFSSWEEVTPPVSNQSAPTDPTHFSDGAQIEHWEAVAALCKLGVITGGDDGAFHPEGTLTRAEAAKLIALLMFGGKEPEKSSGTLGLKTDPTFSDIKGHWAEVYIEYCADMGILSGRGDGTFDPDGPLTGIALTKIALATLGYDAQAYRLTGSSWAVRTDELAQRTDPNLYANLSGVVMDQPISRDNAAQILYNALRAVPRVVKPSPNPDGVVTWQFAPATNSDGSPQSLLQQRFNLTEVGPLPSQPK